MIRAVDMAFLSESSQGEGSRGFRGYKACGTKWMLIDDAGAMLDDGKLSPRDITPI